MIERHWKGIAKPGSAGHYIKHLESKTFSHLRELTGFVHVSILRRPVVKGVEFLIVTVWDSIESIKRFAGEDVELANVPPEAQEMMVEYELRARHYEQVLTTR